MRRNKHSLSNYRLLTCDMGKLIPVNVLEVLPGDTFQQQTSALIRCQPMVAPVMHPVQVRLHHWYVPNRILWDGWEDFITGGSDGTGTEDPYPTITLDGSANGLADYLGIPPVNGLEVGAFPFRAYAKIFNEWYRDQDLVATVDEDQTDLLNCAWEKDYFTTARPWPQKGDAISVPLIGEAPVRGIGISQSPGSGIASGQQVFDTADGAVTYANAWLGQGTDTVNVLANPDDTDSPLVTADLSQGVAADVEMIRRGFALQKYQEARARYGSRYTEYLRYLGVNSSDARLQRPEFLGGGRATISFSEVLQTAPDDSGPESSFVGELKGHGIAALKTRKYRKYFEEHGHVITLMSVRPKSIYADHVHRKWLRRTKEDYWQKELETLGQQEITNTEVYGDAGNSAETWGYVDRYREYREENSIAVAEFRELQNYWHLARDFDAQPVLNEDFVKCEPTKRIFAAQENHVLNCMVNNSVQARRMVRRFARPAGLA